jgi:hypothetical protein
MGGRVMEGTMIPGRPTLGRSPLHTWSGGLA